MPKHFTVLTDVCHHSNARPIILPHQVLDPSPLQILPPRTLRGSPNEKGGAFSAAPSFPQKIFRLMYFLGFFLISIASESNRSSSVSTRAYTAGSFISFPAVPLPLVSLSVIP